MRCKAWLPYEAFVESWEALTIPTSTQEKYQRRRKSLIIASSLSSSRYGLLGSRVYRDISTILMYKTTWSSKLCHNNACGISRRPLIVGRHKLLLCFLHRLSLRLLAKFSQGILESPSNPLGREKTDQHHSN